MVDEALARSFEGIGEDYDRFRPGFPDAAADVVLPSRVSTALDLGAGTGKFTTLLRDRADSVIAVEPSDAMLDVLRAKLPWAEARKGTAESIPCTDRSVDVVTVAQAFHWFDRASACREIGRVLTTGGTLGLLWNRSDPDCEWDQAAHRIAHPAVAEQDGTSSSAADELPGFEFVRREAIATTEPLTRSDYLARWGTVSTFLVADEERRAAMTAQIEAVLDDEPATVGREVLDLPIVTDVFVYRLR